MAGIQTGNNVGKEIRGRQKEIDMKVLIIAARNFGDAVILNLFVTKLGQAKPQMSIDVITKKQFGIIFQNNKYIHKLIFVKFPIASFKSLNFIPLLREAKKRYGEYDLAIDVIGDFRERAALYLFGAKRILSVDREVGHPFNKLIRRGLKFLVEPIPITCAVLNYYSQLDEIFKYIGCYKEASVNQRTNNIKTIGIHPFASQECRMWEWDKWRELIIQLQDEGYLIKIFCAPNEKNVLVKEFQSEIVNIQIISGNISTFFKELANVDYLIGLDSFAVHAAYSLGIPNIMLNGANDYRLWQNPLCDVILGKHECKSWPCYNVPHDCEYECIKAISVQDVIDTIDRIKKQ